MALDNLRYWGVSPSPGLAATRRMCAGTCLRPPRHYVMWALREAKKRKVAA